MKTTIINTLWESKDFKPLNEDVDYSEIKKTLSTQDKGDYIVKKYLWSGDSYNCPDFEVESAYSKDGKYLGDPGMAKMLTELGIKHFEYKNPSSSVCCIGFNDSDDKWYGWSHRSIFGFKIGDKIFDSKFGDDDTDFSQHGTEDIKTFEDAKLSAKNFSDWVS